MKKAAMICMLFLVGCAPVRQLSINLADEELKNSETIQEASLKLIEAWPAISGMVRAYLGDDIPLSVVKVMDRLDALSDQTEWTEKELGEIAGLRLWLCRESVQRILEIVAPEILLYLI